MTTNFSCVINLLEGKRKNLSVCPQKEKEMERRKSPRVSVEVNLQLWKDDKIEKRTKGVIKNINLDGLCVDTDFPSDIGTDLVFRLDTPCELKFNIYGKIIWQKKVGKVFRYGTKFTKLDITDKPKLYKFILITVCLNEQE